MLAPAGIVFAIAGVDLTVAGVDLTAVGVDLTAAGIVSAFAGVDLTAARVVSAVARMILTVAGVDLAVAGVTDLNSTEFEFVFDVFDVLIDSKGASCYIHRANERSLNDLCGAIAQLEERLTGSQEVRGSNPLSSTTYPTFRVSIVTIL